MRTGCLRGRYADVLDGELDQSSRPVDAAALTSMRRLLLSAEPDNSLERNWNWRMDSLDFAGTLGRRGKSYNGYPVSPGYFGAFCMDGLSMALHAVHQTTSFDAAIARCVNQLGDADSTAAVAGQIAGAMYGLSAVDRRFVDAVAAWDDREFALRGVLLSQVRSAADGATHQRGDRENAAAAALPPSR